MKQRYQMLSYFRPNMKWKKQCRLFRNERDNIGENSLPRIDTGGLVFHEEVFAYKKSLVLCMLSQKGGYHRTFDDGSQIIHIMMYQSQVLHCD